MIDYANFSKHLRVKHLKMRIKIHAKCEANALIHIHTHQQQRQHDTHLWFTFVFRFVEFNSNSAAPAIWCVWWIAPLFQLVIDNIMQERCMLFLCEAHTLKNRMCMSMWIRILNFYANRQIHHSTRSPVEKWTTISSNMKTTTNGK